MASLQLGQSTEFHLAYRRDCHQQTLQPWPMRRVELDDLVALAFHMEQQDLRAFHKDLLVRTAELLLAFHTDCQLLTAFHMDLLLAFHKDCCYS
jgi:hypothetical protein